MPQIFARVLVIKYKRNVKLADCQLIGSNLPHMRAHSLSKHLPCEAISMRLSGR
jgi:hypothetical protein